MLLNEAYDAELNEVVAMGYVCECVSGPGVGDVIYPFFER